MESAVDEQAVAVERTDRVLAGRRRAAALVAHVPRSATVLHARGAVGIPLRDVHVRADVEVDVAVRRRRFGGRVMAALGAPGDQYLPYSPDCFYQRGSDRSQKEKMPLNQVRQTSLSALVQISLVS